MAAAIFKSRIAVAVLVLQTLWYTYFVPRASAQMFNNRRVFCEMDGVGHPGENHTATVFFLHNTNEFGLSMKLYVELVYPLFPFKHIKVMYPNAPLSYYAPLIGLERFTWFDELGRGPQWKEITEDAYELAVEGLTNLIIREIQHQNLTDDKIIIGGYDQGGAMAMHMAYRYFRDIGGVFALSSYLCNDSIVYKELGEFKAERLPPLYYVTGANNEVINPEWAESTFARLQKLGVPGEFHMLKDLGYEINQKEIVDLRDWIIKRLGTD